MRTVEGNTFYLNGVTIAGQVRTPRGLTGNDYKTMQPRIGFSYDLFGDGKTVLRGGYGNFYERMQGNDVYNVATAAPFSNTPSVSNTTLSDPYTSWQTGAVLSSASLPVVPQGPTSIAQNYRAPGVAQFSLGVQREIVPSMVLVTQYVGNLAWHQNVQLPINTFPLSTLVGNPSGGQRRKPDQRARRRWPERTPGFNQITEETNLATGTYNSFQIGLRQQSRRGLSFEVDYTYVAPDRFAARQRRPHRREQSVQHLKYDKGSGNLDRRHILNMNYMYNLPIFAHSTGMAHSILGGWEISGTVDRANRSSVGGQQCSRLRRLRTRSAWAETTPSVPT